LSSKKLLEQCQKLDKYWSHIFTSSLDLTSDHWYNKLVDLVDKQQTAPIWMSETKVSLLEFKRFESLPTMYVCQRAARFASRQSSARTSSSCRWARLPSTPLT
jgi:hypothetical protein